MDEPDLFDYREPDEVPDTHTHDPITSKIASARHRRSGRRHYHGEIVLALVAANPGSTAVELWEKASAEQKAELHEMQEVRRRLTVLMQVGRIRQGPPRKCTVKGSLMVTWDTV